MPSSSPSLPSGEDFSAIVAMAMANANAMRLEQGIAPNPWQHLAGGDAIAAAAAASATAVSQQSNKRPRQNHNHNRQISGRPTARESPEVIVIDSDHDETSLPMNNSTEQHNPQNPEETRLLKELPQFEASLVLRIIRRINGANASDSPTTTIPLTATQVLLHIPAEQQRIQDEQQQLLDARQMDQARLMSEEENQKRLAEERKRLKERIKVAPFSELLQIFANSWLLHANKSTTTSATENDIRTAITQLGLLVEKRASLRKNLVKMLNLEQDAQKYYKTVAEIYFVSKVQPALDEHVAAATESSSSSSALKKLEKFVKEQVDCLEKAMYSRSEQTGGATGGVPKLFQEEYDKQKPNGDDEIQLLETRSAEPAALDPSQTQVID